MAAFTTALLALSSIIGNAAAVPGTVALKFQRSVPKNQIVKRAPTSVDLVNNVTYGLYYVTASVGTPGQQIQLQIDTGSSDVWMFNEAACASAQCIGGSYDASSSSTYKLLEEGQFQIQYVTPGSGVEGDYISDDFALGSLKLTDLTMAVATQAAQVQTGIMGIGFDSDESIASQAGTIYPSIIDVMYNQSVIESHSYSLWLDDEEAKTGTILFGGYDTGKFQGQLTVLDIQPDAQSGTISSFTVVWSVLALTDSTGTTAVATDGFPYAAVLDSGTTLMAVPQAVFDPIAAYFGVEESEEYGAVFPCKYGQWKGTLDFGFGGDSSAIIQVPFSELAIPTTDENGDTLKFRNGDQACLFGLEATPQDGIYLLGDTLLRSAYVVYDMDAQQVAIAQAAWGSTETHVSAIGSGTNLASLIPSASYASNTVQVTQTATDVSVEPGFGYGTATGTNVDESGASTATGTLSHIVGVKTTLALASVTGTAATGNSGSGSGSGGSGSSTSPAGTGTGSSTTGAAAVTVPALDRGILFTLAAAVIMMAGGGALFAQL